MAGKRPWPRAGAGGYVVRPASIKDAHDLAPRLSPSCLDELRCTRRPPLHALTYAVHFTPHSTHTLLLDGKIVGMGGMTIDRPGARRRIGVVWFLGSVEAVDEPVNFTRLAHGWIEHYQRKVHEMTNVIPADNKIGLSWLKSLGFDIDPAPVHFSGVPFLRFRRFGQRP